MPVDETNGIYTNFLHKMANQTLNWDTANIYCMLQRDNSSYTFNKDHVFRDEIISAGFTEPVASGYTSGGIAIAPSAPVLDTAFDRVELTCPDINFGDLGAGHVVHGYVLYVNVGSAATDILVCYVGDASGFPATLGGGQFLIAIDAQGQIQIAQP